MDSETTPEAVRMRQLAGTAWAAPFRHFGALFRFGTGPLLIAMILWPPVYTLRSNAQIIHSLTDEILSLRDLLGFLVALPLAAAFAAAWNRLVITGQEGSMGSFRTLFDRRAWRVAWAFVRLLPVLAGAVVILLIPWWLAYGHYADGQFSFYIPPTVGLAATPVLIGVLVSGIIITWFLLRFSLVIPAAAMGSDIKLRESWSLSRKLHFRMLGALLLLMLGYIILVVLFFIVVAFVGGQFGPSFSYYAGMLPLFLTFIFGHALWAGLLGGTYRAVRGAVDRAELAAFD